MNLISVTGHVASDLAVKTMQDGELVVTFYLSTPDDGDSGCIQVAMYFRIAKHAAACLSKGSHITVTGIPT